MEADGNCLFRAIANQLFGDAELHYRLRREACKYMSQNKDLYEDYMENDRNINDYIAWMKRDGTFGG